MLNYIPMFAHDDRGGLLKDRFGHNKMAGAYYASTQTYLQFSDSTHIHHMDSAKLIDVAIYQGLLAVSPPCKYWRVELREGKTTKAVWQIPFDKLRHLIACKFVKTRKYPGFAEQYEIPLDEFNNKETPIQERLV